MSTQQITSVSPVLFVVSPLAAAQWAGDDAYDRTLAETHDGYQAAVAYHVEFMRVGRQNGAAPNCECDLCQPEMEH